MAQLARTARMKIRVGSRTLDTNDVTLRSPLDEQVMLVWYTAHARVAAADNAEESDGGVSGNLNMHWHVKDLFGCTDDDARYASSRIRQVLKKVSAARCISVGGAGHSPIWWISDTLPDNIVTVAEWVTANHKTVDPQREGYKVKPTRAEKRLSEHEAGEDRPPAPVTVIKPAETGDEVTATFTELADPPAQDMETSEVEVEGPVDSPVKHPHIQAQKEEYERWLKMVVEIIAEHGPLSGMEVATIIGLPPYSIVRTESVITRACRDLTAAGTLVARYETAAEQTARQTEHEQKGGRPARLFAVNSEQLATARDTYVSSTGSIVRPGAETEELPQPGPVTPPTTTATFRERMLEIGQAAIALAAQLPDTSEVDELTLMKELLEEENDKLRDEIATLREQIQREKDRAAQVRALYGD